MSHTNVKTTVTPALHPKTLDNIEGLDDTTRPYIANVATVMDEAYQAIDAIHTARQKASDNFAWTPAQQLLHVSLFAEKHQQRVLKQVDSVVKNLDKAIKATDEMLQGPLEQQAGLGSINEEIRRHVKALGTEERRKFLQDANANGDVKSMTAVLGAPPFLSGMSTVEQKHYLREFHMKRNPDATRRLAVMKAALDMLNERAPLILVEVEKAMGQSWHKVQLVRNANSEAEKAFIIRDSSAV